MPSVQAFDFEALKQGQVFADVIYLLHDKVGKLFWAGPLDERAVAHDEEKFAVPLIAEVLNLLQSHLLDWLVLPFLNHSVVL